MRAGFSSSEIRAREAAVVSVCLLSMPAVTIAAESESGIGTFTAHYGTTMENFRTCGVRFGNRIFFDKAREPRHRHPEIEVSYGAKGAANFAITRAIGHSIWP